MVELLWIFLYLIIFLGESDVLSFVTRNSILKAPTTRSFDTAYDSHGTSNVLVMTATNSRVTDPATTNVKYRQEKPARFIHPQVFKMFQRAQYLIRNGDNVVAQKLLLRCLELNPYDSHSWLALGRLEGKLGNLERAREVFSESLMRCPKNVHLLHAWGHLEQVSYSFKVISMGLPTTNFPFHLPLFLFPCGVCFRDMEMKLQHANAGQKQLRLIP